MVVSIFGKHGCARCLTTRNKVRHYLELWGVACEISLQFYDMDTPTGLAEGAWRDVDQVPTTIIEDGGVDLVRWAGRIPRSDELRRYLAA